jgi:hypothetical protein
MIKLFLSVIPILAVLITAPFTSSEEAINFKVNCPSVIKPGSDFTIIINISKGEISGTGKFQQYLPPGFTASEIQSSGAVFAFEDHSVKFFWEKLPTENEFSISYNVHTENNIIGMQNINGLFVYWEENKAQRIAVTPIELKIDNSFAGSEVVNKPEVQRRLISISPENGEYRVELTVKTNDNKEWARFTDDIPSTFSAELIEAHNAFFSNTNHNVVFRWEKLPAEPEFTVSYLVRSGKPGPPPVINGVLVFGNQNADNLPADKKPVADNNVNEDYQNTFQKANTGSVAMKNTQSENTDRGFITGQNMDQETNVDETAKVKAPFFQKLKGLFFSVQISATKRSSLKQSNWFNSKYQINSNVEVAYHEGWKKYHIGNFSSYADAKSFSSKTREKIPDAFVVACENGSLISVKEALYRKSINP